MTVDTVIPLPTGSPLSGTPTVSPSSRYLLSLFRSEQYLVVILYHPLCTLAEGACETDTVL